MRIAYVDHSYHKKTLSTRAVLYDVLKRYGHDVHFFWDETWNEGVGIKFEDIKNYDIIINFQSAALKEDRRPFSLLHDNVVFVPMFDQFSFPQNRVKLKNVDFSPFFYAWKGSKILSFSSSLHYIAKSHGVMSYLTRYYQPPRQNFQCPEKGLHGFFWLRDAQQISWPTVRALLGDTKFESLHLHLAIDPHTPKPELPTQEEVEKYNITTSNWFENKKDFDEILDKANIFFAPRVAEGIGQSFLEAFSRGQCVVAPNEVTMNEYILHNHNGILYDYSNPRPIDFKDALQFGGIAKAEAEKGYEQWLAHCDNLVGYIIRPQRDFYGKDFYDSLKCEDVQAKENITSSKQHFLPQTLTCTGISWEAVTWAYRLLLGRDPENIDAILSYSKYNNQREMVRAILKSDECIFAGNDNYFCSSNEAQRNSEQKKQIPDYTKYQESISKYHYDIIVKINELFDIRGKKIVDIGGSNIPASLMKEFGVAQFICIDPISKWRYFHGNCDTVNVFYDKPVYKADSVYKYIENSFSFIIDEDIENIDMSCIMSFFDVAFSISTFEHVTDVSKTMDICYNILNDQGVFYSQYEPIFSCGVGHHVYLNEKINFTNRDILSILDFAHILYSQEETRALLQNIFSIEEINDILYAMYDSPVINRSFFSEHIKCIMNSRFNDYKINFFSIHEVDAKIMEILKVKFGEMRFDVRGISIFCKK